MIEFKGKYYQYGKKAFVEALIQYDGILLHVWHLSEPFHRLLSSDCFHLNRSLFGNTTTLKLPNGSRVETEDSQALEELALKCHDGVQVDHPPLRQNWVFMFLGSVTLVLGAIWLAKNGLLLF